MGTQLVPGAQHKKQAAISSLWRNAVPTSTLQHAANRPWDSPQSLRLLHVILLMCATVVPGKMLLPTLHLLLSQAQPDSKPTTRICPQL